MNTHIIKRLKRISENVMDAQVHAQEMDELLRRFASVNRLQRVTLRKVQRLLNGDLEEQLRLFR